MKIIVFLTAMLLCFPLYASSNTIENIRFTSGDVQLAGSIVFPSDNEAHSAIVFVHGSGKQTRSLYWAKRFAANGIAALVYDKRGVGESGGNYESKQNVSEKNLTLLAQDAKAALQVLAKHHKTTHLALGLTGISQAGWIIPLAAENNELVNFIALWSGPVCKVSEEDIFSKYTSDLDGNHTPSYAEALNARKRKYVWPDFLGKDTNPNDSLQKLTIPGLWVFGENDGSVPVDLSVERLNLLRKSGGQFEYVLFSGLGHNNMQETFNVVTDWIKRLPQ